MKTLSVDFASLSRHIEGNIIDIGLVKNHPELQEGETVLLEEEHELQAIGIVRTVSKPAGLCWEAVIDRGTITVIA